MGRRKRRPPRLHVLSRSRELSLIDGPASAFQLAVDAPKLCKFRRYGVALVVPRAWRREHDLSEAQVMDALLGAKCCRSGTAVVVGCARCRCQPVVSLVPLSKSPQVCVLEDGTERYTCCIRSHCSSSRDHLKSSLVLVLDALPLREPLVSNTFVLLARDKSHAPKRDPADDATDRDSAA